MRVMAVALSASLLLGGLARAQSPAQVPAPQVSVAPGDQAAIRRVIQQQLDAFRHDDGPAAFAEASPGIQAQFAGNPDIFMGMVRRGYQPVYRPRSTAFGPALMQGGRVVQTLDVIGPDGAGHQALYFMERESDGSWRISGCVLTDRASVAA